MGKTLVSVLWILFCAVVAVKDPSAILNVRYFPSRFLILFVDPDVADNAYEKWRLPHVQEMQRGFDISSGERKSNPIFRLTYNKSADGNVDFLVDDNFAQRTYMIPDQLAGTNWGRSCSDRIVETSSAVSSVSEYLKTTSSGADVGFDQTADVSVKVPVERAQVSASTQVRAALGFSQSDSAEEYYRHMKEGQKNVTSQYTRAELWKLEWTKIDLYGKQVTPDQLEADFVESVRRLMAICVENPPDYEGRTVGAEKALSRTRCDEAAKSFVERYGTHYTSMATFGGTIFKSYFYNEQSMTDVQKSYVQEYAKSEFSFLFSQTSKQNETEKKYEEAKMSEVVSEGETVIRGGDSRAKSMGDWCSTVQLSPTIIKNDKFVVISELIYDEVSKYAVAMAILDRWYCNGGTAIINKTTGITTCTCPENHDFVLDDYCIPREKTCYDKSGKKVKCISSRLIIGYTRKFERVWTSLATTKPFVSVYAPILEDGYEMIGPVLVPQYKEEEPQLNIPVLHQSTSTNVAVEAKEYVAICNTRGKVGGTAIPLSALYVPVCPSGYGAVSDFSQRNEGWPGYYADKKIRPCIIEQCLVDCPFQKAWSSKDYSSEYEFEFYRSSMCEGSPGCDVGSSAGFYRVWCDYETEPSPERKRCINPQCITEKERF